MEVAFKTKKWEKQYVNSKEAVRAYGAQVASKFTERINIIKAASGFEELKRLPGLNCHQLQGERRGQWAVKLTGRYRLIVQVMENTGVVVLEVSNHYGD